jgi:sterol desaturase/sphingolipid hydroxylase (fatty acid hydroxylase superfamily)
MIPNDETPRVAHSESESFFLAYPWHTILITGLLTLTVISVGGILLGIDGTWLPWVISRARVDIHDVRTVAAGELALVFGLRGFSMLALVLLVEACCLGWRRSTFLKILRFGIQTRRDLAWWILNRTSLAAVLGQAMTFGAAAWLAIWVSQRWGHLALLELLPYVWLKIVVGFVMADFVSYWIHRGFHHFRPLWALHSVHHSTPDVTPLSTTRAHPAENALAEVLQVVIAALIGTPTRGLLWIAVLTFGYGCLLHADIRSCWGWLGRWVFLVPAHHRMHHSADVRDVNFGIFFIWWDRMFGTYHDPKGAEIRTGVDGYDLGRSLPREFVGQYLRFWGAVLSPVRRLILR